MHVSETERMRQKGVATCRHMDVCRVLNSLALKGEQQTETQR